MVGRADPEDDEVREGPDGALPGPEVQGEMPRLLPTAQKPSSPDLAGSRVAGSEGWPELQVRLVSPGAAHAAGHLTEPHQPRSTR